MEDKKKKKNPIKEVAPEFSEKVEDAVVDDFREEESKPGGLEMNPQSRETNIDPVEEQTLDIAPPQIEGEPVPKTIQGKKELSPQSAALSLKAKNDGGVKDFTFPQADPDGEEKIEVLQKQRDLQTAKSEKYAEEVTASIAKQQELIAKGLGEKQQSVEEYSKKADDFKSQTLRNAEEMHRVRTTANEAAKDALFKISKMTAKIRDFDQKVDSQQFWKNKSAKSKGLIISGLSKIAGSGGNIGAAMGLLNNSIEQEISAQKTNISTKLGALTAAQSAEANLFQQYKQITGDDIAAEEALRSSYKESAAFELQKVAFLMGESGKKNELQVKAEMLTTEALKHRELAATRITDTISKKISEEQKNIQEENKTRVSLAQTQQLREKQNIEYAEKINKQKDKISELSSSFVDRNKTIEKSRTEGVEDRNQDQKYLKEKVRLRDGRDAIEASKTKDGKVSYSAAAKELVKKGYTEKEAYETVRTEQIVREDKKVGVFRSKEAQKEFTANEQGYRKAIEGMSQIKRLAESIGKSGGLKRGFQAIVGLSGKGTVNKTIFNEIKALGSALVGANRVEIVGPGAFTESEQVLVRTALGLEGAGKALSKNQKERFVILMEKKIEDIEAGRKSFYAERIHKGHNQEYAGLVYNPHLDEEAQAMKDQANERAEKWLRDHLSVGRKTKPEKKKDPLDEASKNNYKPKKLF